MRDEIASDSLPTHKNNYSVFKMALKRNAYAQEAVFLTPENGLQLFILFVSIYFGGGH